MLQIFWLLPLSTVVLGLRPTTITRSYRSPSPARATIRAAANSQTLEEGVVTSIRDILAAGSKLQPEALFSALAQFGNSTSGLVQTWLTPQKLEEACFFWYEGSAVVARDLRLGRFTFDDLKASGWLTLLSLGTFPFTPLLFPLVSEAINATDESLFVPRALQSCRVKALKRLRGDVGLAEVASEVRTPQNIEEGLLYFTDGGRLLLRDILRGRMVSRDDDTWSAYAWFSLLSFSTFPLTPLLLPLIDKRRRDGYQSDYVPSSFRAKRLSAFARLRAAREYPSLSPTETVRAAAVQTAEDGGSAGRPPPAILLAAIAALRPAAVNKRSQFLQALAGGGTPGRRWQLVYVAGKNAVISARQAHKANGGRASQASLSDQVSEALLPWTRLKGGVYVDGLVTAIQRFDLESLENENGIFGILGSDWLRFTVVGPFKWPSPDARTVCAFQPDRFRCKVGSLEWESEIATDPAAPFETMSLAKLPFFKFLHVDDKVAVAQGRSGSVAVWARI